jgi:hypothetical protein
MTQNDPKADISVPATQSRPVLKRLARALAGGTCVFALSLPLASTGAGAYDLQVTQKYTSNGWTRTYRKIRPQNFSITELAEPAPGNDCPFSAFEVMNARRGEARCVGFVPPYWDR